MTSSDKIFDEFQINLIKIMKKYEKICVLHSLFSTLKERY